MFLKFLNARAPWIARESSTRVSSDSNDMEKSCIFPLVYIKLCRKRFEAVGCNYPFGCLPFVFLPVRTIRLLVGAHLTFPQKIFGDGYHLTGINIQIGKGPRRLASLERRSRRSDGQSQALREHHTAPRFRPGMENVQGAWTGNSRRFS